MRNATLNGLTVGDGTRYPIEGPITGLGAAPLRTNDVARGHANGSVGANDFNDVRIITIPVLIDGEDDADAWALAEELMDAWSASNTDLDLTIDLAQGVTRTYTGRPGMSGQSPCELDLDDLPGGSIGALLTFRALDPDPS